MSFSSLGLSQALVQALSHNNYTQPYPIQQAAIPAILSKKDVLAIAPTGSGKTAGFVLPILSQFKSVFANKNRQVQVLVLVPTRELAVQVESVFKQFIGALSTPVKSMAVYGGVSINPQMKAMFGVEILVATPGRLLELVDSNAVQLSAVETLVLDEADKMLNLGFADEMKKILALLPTRRQNLLFSATLSKDVDTINQLVLHNPQVIHIEPEGDVLDLINQVGYFVTDDRKGPLLRYLIRSRGLHQVLVFVSSVQRADNVANKLRENCIDARAIHSKKAQGVRTDLLTKFKHKHLRVLVTTDLLSRGIDIEFLPYVVNYELPRSPKDFVHRIGRTGRAENTGEAITFVSPDDRQHFNVIQKKMGKWVTMIDADGMDL